MRLGVRQHGQASRHQDDYDRSASHGGADRQCDLRREDHDRAAGKPCHRIEFGSKMEKQAGTKQQTGERIIVPGPAGFHPPSAAQLGVSLPDPGQGLLYGVLEPDEEKVMEEIARKMLTSPNATIFPGPLV